MGLILVCLRREEARRIERGIRSQIFEMVKPGQFIAVEIAVVFGEDALQKSLIDGFDQAIHAVIVAVHI